ncbi:MAG TPA: ZIP family metal transporter [Bacteroidia bacterium]|nr:ZIP family metal transporter [Bacteroidia bacterium]HNT80800.1 ZIP family metal transporter [Bacteroidia bacterium]
MIYLKLLALFLSILLSGFLYDRFSPKGNNFLKLSLAFTGALLFALCVTDILPHTFDHGHSHTIGFYILGGFLLQIVLEFFTKGIEHGHTHLDHSSSFPITLMAGLSVHSFLEGMPLAEALFTEEQTRNSLFFGILLHHIPVAFALMSMLKHAGLSKIKSYFYLSLFAIMAPLGAIFIQLLGDEFMTSNESFFKYALALVAGIFLHISTTILFEANSNHRFNIIKLLTIIAGFAMAIMLSQLH